MARTVTRRQRSPTSPGAARWTTSTALSAPPAWMPGSAIWTPRISPTAFGRHGRGRSARTRRCRSTASTSGARTAQPRVSGSAPQAGSRRSPVTQHQPTRARMRGNQSEEYPPMAYRVEPNARSNVKATVWSGRPAMRHLDELDRRVWASAIVDDTPQDVDEPIRAMTPPRAPFRWPLCTFLRLRRMVEAVRR